VDEAADRPWNRRDAERALARERERYSTMSVNLLDLADDPTCRLLAGAPLRGATREAWAAADAALNSAWAHLGAYQEALDEADTIFRARPRPGSEELRRLQRLLSQASVSQPATGIPPAEREAAGPATAIRTTSLAQLSTAMEAEYKRVAKVVAAVGEVWQAVDARAGQLAADLEHGVDEGWPETTAAAAELLGERLGRIRALAQSDPLSLCPGWPAAGPVDTTQLEDLRRDLEQLRSEAEDLRRLRETGADRLIRLRTRVELVEAAESAAAARRRHALSRVVADLPAPPDAAPGLRRRLAAAEALHRQHAWTALRAALADLETRVPAAETRAHEAGERAAALLEERDRLRGRLTGYQARARRLGIIEEPAVSLLFRQVQARLWTAPCDLKAAAGAIEGFRRSIEDHTDDDTGGSA
jgi:hypothetical protein